ncbi:hypothetical protein EST38_g11539 [Candolleomyces aberdarensis]|uniref:F-box domain-containing protein n=1 Tax=Candolleomyces aberdarensis TaxID=2316362 RepID=A0A4Q2D7X2_9AGAR|nr:hypothetical protein EST38_g11539 [Candolleomyces aberdarensis]
MLHRSPKAYQKKRSNPRTTFETDNTSSTQHGIHFLLDVPAEILAAISANLDPQSLQHLSETHEYFARHVEQDITWRSAFETHYISNEQSLLLLRRTQPNWRKEFTERFNLLQRFLYSRQPTIAHAPLPSPAISRIHLLSPGDPGFGLLSISLFHGSIARSVPSTGKILPGFIDASGNTTGLGSRTSEFTTNVSACAITSTGGTVRILWGYATGHVAFMVTNKTIENPRRPAAEFRICQFEEMHAGCVTDAVWMTEASDTSYGGEAIAVTGGLDGHIKIWNFSDPSTPDIFWTSPHRPTDLRDPCIKVSCNRALGMVVSVKKSGAVDIWTGFPPNDAERLDLRRIAVRPWRTGEARPSAKVLALHIDPYTRAILVGFHGDICFYRIDIAPEGEEKEEGYKITAFGAPEGGGILSCLHPCFTSRDKEGTESFIFAGDKLGYVSVYPWNDVSSTTITSGSLPTMVRPTHSFQATFQHSGPPSQTQSPSKHRHSPATAFNFKTNSRQQQQQQAAVTAVTWTPTVLATGTSAGDVVVWDSITFERVKEVVRAAKLRRVRRRGGGHHHNLQNAQPQQQAQGQQGQAVPGAGAGAGGVGGATGFEVEDNSVPDDSVKQIIISEKGDTLVINVGGEVVMWKAGEVTDESTHHNKGKVQGGRSRSGKSSSASGSNGRALIGASGKWSEHLEMKQTISESRALYLAGWDAYNDKANPERKAREANERAHRRELEKMGMSEEEMLEYVMMLSREQQEHQSSPSGVGGESGSGRAETSASAIAKETQDALTDEQVQAAIEGGMFALDSAPSAIPTTSESPVPIDRAVSSSSSSSSSPSPGATNLDPEAHFPRISPPISRSSSGSPPATGSPGAQQAHPASLRNRRLSVTSNCTSVSSSSSSSGSWKSAASRASAWSVPLTVASPATATATATTGGGSTSNAAIPSSGGGRARGAWDGLDEDLRFALELSLAEARSRGEDV